MLNSIGVHKFEGFEFINNYSSGLVLVSLDPCGQLYLTMWAGELKGCDIWFSLDEFARLWTMLSHSILQLPIGNFWDSSRQELR
jgi:hypothetical protein